MLTISLGTNPGRIHGRIFMYLRMEKGFMRIKATQNSHPGRPWVRSVATPFSGMAEYHF